MIRKSAAVFVIANLFFMLGASAADTDWLSITEQVDTTKHAVAGQWEKKSGSLLVKASQGARLELPVILSPEYDLRIDFTRRTGQHSVGAVVVHNGTQVAFEADAWGMNLAGFQDVDGKSLRDRTPQKKFKLENGRRYSLVIEVRNKSLRGLIDGREIASQNMEKTRVSLLDVWSLPHKSSAGLLAWECDTEFHRVEVRSVGSEPIRFASGDPKPAIPHTPMPSSNSTPDIRSTGSPGKPKRVLIVIANNHFFYREYGDPREELERAGIQVVVAAGRKEPSRPHNGSGEPNASTQVMPDITLAEAKAADYDAILFSGGWGASMYQFAFEGRYDEPMYNGNRAVKAEANRLINEFIEQDKYVCALCNGTSVLAWARVKGRSPLQGKLVCAPVREAAAGMYNGRHAQPSCRWHAEANGARMSPPGSIGRPNTAADDVAVDGRIITGEDDISAREMGRRIVEVLTKK